MRHAFLSLKPVKAAELPLLAYSVRFLHCFSWRKQMPFDEKTVRDRLMALKQELESYSELSEDARATVTLDQQSVGRLSRMDALQGQAMAQASERQRRADIQKISAALKRLDDGDYGYCVSCDEEIAEKRLEVDPAAAFCIKCAQ